MGPRLTKFTDRERFREGADRAQPDPGTGALGLKAASVGPRRLQDGQKPVVSVQWVGCSPRRRAVPAAS